MTDRGGPGRRSSDRELEQLAIDRQKLIEEHLTLTRQRTRHAREQTWLVRVLTISVFALGGVVTFGMTQTLPELRRSLDAQVCAYRSSANRETRLAQRDRPPSARAEHRRSRDTFRALERATAGGRRVKCKPLIAQGRRTPPRP